MRKEDIASAVIYLIMLSVALIVGLTVIQQAFADLYSGQGFKMNVYLFTVLIILAALLFNIIMLEVLHVVGAKIGGYSVVSFNVLGFCWAKRLGKWKFHFEDFDGLTGETKVSPKSEKAKLTAFVWLPLLGYLIELVVGIILFSMAKSPTLSRGAPLKWIGIASLLFVVVSSMIALYNFVPIKLDSMTDGYRLMLMTKPANTEAYNELMRIENLQREGKEVGEIKVFNEITDFTASINLFTVYDLLAKKEYDKAEEIIDMIIEDPKKISPLTFHRLVAQKLYIKILKLPEEEALKYYDENVDDAMRRFISSDISCEALRAYILIAGVLDKSQAEVQFAHSKKDKAFKRALPARVEIEKELYEQAINIVKEKHPDWEIK